MPILAQCFYTDSLTLGTVVVPTISPICYTLTPGADPGKGALSGGGAIPIDVSNSNKILIGFGFLDCGQYIGGATCPSGTDKPVTWSMYGTGPGSSSPWQFGFSGCACVPRSARRPLRR